MTTRCGQQRREAADDNKKPTTTTEKRRHQQKGDANNDEYMLTTSAGVNNGYEAPKLSKSAKREDSAANDYNFLPETTTKL